MKHWKIERKTYTGHQERKIIVLSQCDRVLAVERMLNGKIEIFEMCDENFGATYTKEEVLEVIDELRAWVVATE